MSCNRPLYRIDVSDPAAVPRLPAIDLRREKNGGIIFGRNELEQFRAKVRNDQIIEIPCGSCLGCRLSYSSSWAVRLMLESKYYPFNWFVTLTYDDDHLPMGEFLDPYDGTVKSSTLVRSHVVNFVKRFRSFLDRRYNHQGLRVFYNGEYGDLLDRPHYHLILMNLPELPRSFLSQNGAVKLYRSDLIEEAWDDSLGIPLGLSSVSDVTFDSCAYVARYMLKKVKGEPLRKINELDLGDLKVRLNPFCGSSRRPGIARRYFDDNFDFLKATDSVLYKDDMRVFRSKPPRYFDHLYDLIDPDGFVDLKDRRRHTALIAPKSHFMQHSETVDAWRERREIALSDKSKKGSKKL